MMPTPAKRRQLESSPKKHESSLEEHDHQHQHHHQQQQQQHQQQLLFNGFSLAQQQQFEQQVASDEDEEEELEFKGNEEECLGDEDEDEFDYMGLDTIVEEDEHEPESAWWLKQESAEMMNENNNNNNNSNNNIGSTNETRQRDLERSIDECDNNAGNHDDDDDDGAEAGADSADYARRTKLLSSADDKRQAIVRTNKGKQTEGNTQNEKQQVAAAAAVTTTNQSERPQAENKQRRSTTLANSMRKFSETQNELNEKCDMGTNEQELLLLADGRRKNPPFANVNSTTNVAKDSATPNTNNSTNTNQLKQQQLNKMQQHQQHHQLPSTNRLISEHQARQQQALFRALAQRQKMLEEMGADEERVDLMSATGFNHQQQQQLKQQQPRRRRPSKPSSRSGRRKRNEHTQSSEEAGVPLSLVDLSSMSDRMLDELLGHIASASSSSLSSNGESLDSSDLSSNASGQQSWPASSDDDEEGAGQAAGQSASSFRPISHQQARGCHQLVSSHHQLVDQGSPNVVGVHEDERVGRPTTTTLGLAPVVKLNCRNAHKRSRNNGRDDRDADDDDDDNDHELVVRIRPSEQQVGESLSPIGTNNNRGGGTRQPAGDVKKTAPGCSSSQSANSRLEQYFTSGLVQAHEFDAHDTLDRGREHSRTTRSISALSSAAKSVCSASNQDDDDEDQDDDEARIKESVVAESSMNDEAQQAEDEQSRSKPTSAEDVLRRMLEAVNEVNIEEQQELNKFLERGFAHLEQLLSCNLSPNSSNLTKAQQHSASSTAAAAEAATSAVRSQQQPTATVTSHNKLISNQQQQQLLHQSAMSKDSDYGSDTPSADCFSHYTNTTTTDLLTPAQISMNSQQQQQRNISQISTSQLQARNNLLLQSESPSPTSLATTNSSTTSCSTAPSSSTTARPQLQQQQKSTVSGLSPLATELATKLAESLHRLAQQQHILRARAAANQSVASEPEAEELEDELDHQVEEVKVDEKKVDEKEDAAEGLESETPAIKQKEEPTAPLSNLKQQSLGGNGKNKKSPMKSVVMLNATRSPSAGSIVSFNGSESTVTTARNMTPEQQQISTSQLQAAPARQPFKTCVSIGGKVQASEHVRLKRDEGALASSSSSSEISSEPVDLKSKNKTEKRKKQELETATPTPTTTTKYTSQNTQTTQATAISVNFDRRRLTRSSLRRRSSFNSDLPKEPRPGSPIPLHLISVSTTTAEAAPVAQAQVETSELPSLNKKQEMEPESEQQKQQQQFKQRQLQRALILAQKYNYSPAMLAASKLSSELQLQVKADQQHLTSSTLNSSSNNNNNIKQSGPDFFFFNGAQTLDRTSNSQQRLKLTNNSQESEKPPAKCTGQVQLDISYFAKSGSLTIHLLQCAQLAPVSKRRTTSNPYVKLYLLPDRSKGGKRKSSIQRQQLNPTFDEKFTFGPIQFAEFVGKILWLSVWHKDRLGRNEFLGELLLPLEQVRSQLLSSDLCQSTAPKWYQLEWRVGKTFNTQPHANSATIKRGAGRQLNSTTTKSQFDAESDNHDATSSLTLPSSHRLAGEKNRQQQPNHLLSAGARVNSKPHRPTEGTTCELATDKLNEFQRKANRLTAAVAPPGGGSYDDTHHHHHHRYSTSALSRQPSELYSTRGGGDPQITGQLFVALKFVPDNQELVMSTSSRQQIANLEGQLQVIIKEAHNIGGFEAPFNTETGQPPSGPLPNPFCKCYLLDSGGQRIAKQKTPHLKRTANPRWDITCTFHRLTLGQLSAQAVEILMFNRDSILVSNKHEYLGAIRLCRDSPEDTTSTQSVAGEYHHQQLCSERESRLWNQMLQRPNIWVYGELRLRHLDRPLIEATTTTHHQSSQMTANGSTTAAIKN